MQSSWKFAGLSVLVLVAAGCANGVGGMGASSGYEDIPGWQLMSQSQRDANRQRQQAKPTMDDCRQMAEGRTREVQARAMARGEPAPALMSQACAEQKP